MLRQERQEDQDEMIIMVQEGWQSTIYTALPAIITDVSEINGKRVVAAQPAIQAQIRTPEGELIWTKLPILINLPVFFPSGGGFTLTFPIAVGDECLVIFSQRCIDNWWYLGCPEDSNGQIVTQTQAEMRMHDISDGMAFVGFNSVPNVIPDISITATQLRSDDGECYVEVAEENITINAPNTCTIIAPNVVVNSTNTTINATTAVVNTDTANINASVSVEIDCPTTTVTGELIVEGLLTYQDGIAGSGGTHGSHISGNLIQVSGVLSSEGIPLATHRHTGVQGGSDDTGGPVT